MKRLFYLLTALVLILNYPAAQSQDTIINILHINDTHSNYAKGHSRDSNLKGTYGGMAKAASVLGYARQQDKEALLFHAGDFFMGDAFFYFYFGVPELMWMKQMGFNALTIGNHEFDLGTGGLIQAIQTAFVNTGGFPLLSANLVSNDAKGDTLKSLIRDCDTITVHGIKVGFFGMTAPEANITSLPAPSISVMNESYFNEIVTAQVQKLKSEGAKLIIFLSHLGLMADTTIASSVPGIDIIIGGHDHFELENPIIINGANNTYCVQAGAFFENVGAIHVKIKNGKLDSLHYNLIHLDENIPDEPNTAALINNLISSLDSASRLIFTIPIAEVKETFNERPPDLLKPGNHNSAVGCLITTALRDFGKTDIGITVGGLSSQPLYKGAILPEDVIKMIGYGINEYDLIGYNIATYNISGAALKAGLGFCLSLISSNDDYLPQMSGMEYKYTIDGGPKLDKITINGKDIDDNKLYSVTSNYAIYSFMGKLGIPIQNDTVFQNVSEFKVLTNYIASKGILDTNQFHCDCEAITGVNFKETTIINKDMEIFPNPSNIIAALKINIINPGDYSIDIYSLANMKEINMGCRFFDSGINFCQIDLSNLSTGGYLVRLKNNNSIIVGKLAVVR